MRTSDSCECKEGWGGINCNVCTSDKACNALMPVPEEGGGVCYKNGDVVKENYQMCDVTNAKIIEILKGKKPQVTFTCNREDGDCAFQCKTFRSQLCAWVLILSSLGPGEGVILLRLGYLRCQYSEHPRPKQHQLQM